MNGHVVALGLVLVALGPACGSSGTPAARDGAAGDAAGDGARAGLGGSAVDAPAPDRQDGAAASSDAADTASADAGDAPSAEVPGALPDAYTPDALPSGKLAFDVTAALAIVPPPDQVAAWTSFPRTVSFTLVWNATSGAAVAGAAGHASGASVTSAGDGLFRTDASLAFGVPFGSSCGAATFAAVELTFSTDGATLVGTARGTLTYQTNDTTWSAPATAVLTGKPDTTPPTLSLPQSPVDPLAPLVFAASEPMPSTTVASIVSRATGEVPSLAATFVSGAGAAISFTAPNLALRPGDTYDVRLGPDFAGNEATTTMSFTTAAAPPLVPEDGFESVTGTMFAGAAVLHGGPLTPIAGQTSLMLNTGFGGGFGFLPYDLGPSVAVRLAVSRGDTVVRFDTQLIAPDPIDSAAFVGAIRVASFQGLSVSLLPGVIASSMNVSGTDFVKQTLPQLGDVFISPVKTVEIALPAGAADQDELTFEIAGVTFSCSAPPSPTVLVLDNLRVE